MTPSRRRQRRIAAAIALLWVALPVATVVHGVIETHTYCVQHQTLEHAAPAHEHGGAANAIYGVGADAHAHGDACAFSQARFRDEAIAPTATVTCASPYHVGVDVPLRPQTSSPQLSILSTAPKSSPPA